MVFSNNLLLGAAGAGGGYEIDQSIRFDSVRNSDLTRTLSGDGNLNTGTFSFWMKRSGLGFLQEIFTTYSIRSSFFFNSNDTLAMQIYNGASYTTLTTTAVFRDPSAFAHYLFRWDTTQATDTDRLQFYYNGVLQTVTGAYPAQNSTTTFSDATYTHVISGDGSANTLYEIDGYLAEIHYVDGTALAATDFGEYNADGVWVPIEYTGSSYGTNGFYITGATASDLGEDFSGNNNDYTSSGLATTDQMVDTPTNNYCTLSPIDKNSNVTLADGNLVASAGGGWYHGRGTLFAPSGKWYYEWIPTAGSYALAGWMLNVSGNDYFEEESDVATTFYRGIGAGNGFYIGSGAADTGPTNFSLNDVVMMAIDVDTMKMWVGVNGTWYNSGDPAAGTNPVGTWTAAIGQSVAPWYGLFTSTSETFNFGQRPFTYTIPTGFNSWNTSNLPTPSITDGSAHFQPTIYTGTGSSRSVDQSGNSTFEPSFVWVKARNVGYDHALYDQVRGVTKELKSNDTSAESTITTGLTAFESDGFQVGSRLGVNGSSDSFVAWQWKANGTGSSNTDGSITSTVSANTTAGFSIVSYVSNDTAGATVGHGLGVAPSMVIQKNRDSTDNWYVLHTSLSGAGYNLYLDLTNGEDSNSAWWNGTNPTSTVVTLGPGNGAGSGPNEPSGENRIMYCFAEIPGYSSFGSYTGNGSTDGPFIYTGFAPEFIMVKSSSNSGTNWDILDATRETFNTRGNQLFANSNAAEASNDHECDFLSNGFKWRDGSGSNNGSGYTIIYMAFAKHPFGGDGVAPATAR